MQLYEHALSGHCHKVRLLLGILGRDYERIEVDIPAGGGQAPDYLALNPLGTVPALVDGDVRLRDSHAILAYLGGRYGGEAWLPRDPADLARVVQWLAFAANELHNGPHLLRLKRLLGVPVDLAAAQATTDKALGVLDRHLAGRSWLELGRPTVADIACFPSTALAGDGGVDLRPYAEVRGWIERIRALPGFVSMPGL